MPGTGNALDPYAAGGYGGYAATDQQIATPTNGPQNLNGWLAAARQGQALQQGQVQISQQEYDLATSRTQGFARLLQSAAANPTLENMTNIIGEGVSNGTLPQDMATRALAAIGPMNDQQRGQFIYSHLQQLGNYQQLLDNGFGAQTTVNQGGSIAVLNQGRNAQGQPVLSSPSSGVTSLPTTLTPDAKTARVPFVDPRTGAASSASVGQLYDARGNFTGPQGGGVAPASGNALAPPQPAPAAGASGSGAAAQSAAPPSQPAGSGGTLTTALSPGQSNALAGSAGAWNNLVTDVASPMGVNYRVDMLRSALDALRSTSTGQGTAARQKILSGIAALPGGSALIPQSELDKLSNFDLANKYMTAYAANTPGAARSDAGLSTAGAANASVNITPAAAQSVVLHNIGLERMKQAQAQAFITSGQDPGQFSNWSSQFGRNLDPRAFALGDMTPAERTKFYSGLKGKDLTNFNATVRVGLANNILNKSDLAGGTDGQ